MSAPFNDLDAMRTASGARSEPVGVAGVAWALAMAGASRRMKGVTDKQTGRIGASRGKRHIETPAAVGCVTPRDG